MAYLSLPSPSHPSCGTPQLTAGALVAATATCIGFFSYDFQLSGESDGAFGALSGTGPFTPASLTYLWVCDSVCPKGAGAESVWLTTYAPAGSYTSAGCPTSTESCSDPDWSTAVPATRYLGQFTGTAAVFSYADTADSPVPLDSSLLPPSVVATALPTVLVVRVTVSVASLSGETTATSIAVPVTGNVYESSTNGNG
jgi:hypothetical protein